MFFHYVHCQSSACHSFKKNEKLAVEESWLTDSSDNSPSKEKGGTDVPEASLIG